MKNKLMISFLVAMIFCFVSCGSETVVSANVENVEELKETTFGKSEMVEIGNGLYYDATTRNVYWWNGIFNYTSATMPSPYYAPNGLPYKYNPETNTFEENDYFEKIFKENENE